MECFDAVRSMYKYRLTGCPNCIGKWALRTSQERDEWYKCAYRSQLESRDETNAIHVHGVSGAWRVWSR